jgi:hypothetical protein
METTMGKLLDSRDQNVDRIDGADKASGHPLFGCMKGTVTIPEGADLTEPACPEWADLIDELMPLSQSKASGA